MVNLGVILEDLNEIWALFTVLSASCGIQLVKEALDFWTIPLIMSSWAAVTVEVGPRVHTELILAHTVRFLEQHFMLFFRYRTQKRFTWKADCAAKWLNRVVQVFQKSVQFGLNLPLLPKWNDPDRLKLITVLVNLCRPQFPGVSPGRFPLVADKEQTPVVTSAYGNHSVIEGCQQKQTVLPLITSGHVFFICLLIVLHCPVADDHLKTNTEIQLGDLLFPDWTCWRGSPSCSVKYTIWTRWSVEYWIVFLIQVKEGCIVAPSAGTSKMRQASWAWFESFESSCIF